MSIKRIFDILVMVIAAPVIVPLLITVFIIVYFFIGRPVLFMQVRPGLHGQPFRMVKFRTMTDAVDENGSLLPDAERLTRFGSFLRSTSLDELPELWNVICGHMSLVGPRPLLIEYLSLYTEVQARRHEVRPGITGWAQINGRNAISWEKRFDLDVWYVDNQTLFLDVKILCLTVSKIFRREGINAEGAATMDKFKGE